MSKTVKDLEMEIRKRYPSKVIAEIVVSKGEVISNLASQGYDYIGNLKQNIQKELFMPGRELESSIKHIANHKVLLEIAKNTRGALIDDISTISKY